MNKCSAVITIISVVIAILAAQYSPKPAQAICAFEQGLNQMTVKASGHNLYLLWESRIGGFNSNVNNYTLFFKKSSDNGMTFGSTTNLYSTSQQPCYTLFSQMDIDKNSKGSDNVYVAWIGDGGIQFRASSDGGETFGKTSSLGWGSFGTMFGPALIDWGGQMVTDSNNGVYITSVSQDYPTQGRYVLFTRSTDGGNAFDAATTFGNSNNHHQTPQVAVSGSNVYLVWSEYSGCGGYDADNCHVQIMFTKSTDRGKTFENAISLSSGKRITNSTQATQNSSNCFGDFFCGIPHYPAIKAVGSSVYVSWLYNASETYFTRSTDSGATFSTPVKVSEPISHTESGGDFASPYLNAYDNGRVEIGWIMNNGTGFYLESVDSDDRGNHFYQAHPPMLTTWGDSPANLLQHFAFTNNGTIYSLQTDFHPDQNIQHLVFSVNSDNETTPKSTVLASNTTAYFQWRARVTATDTGNVYAVWQNNTAYDKGVLQPPIVLRISDDNGSSFGNPIVVQQAVVIPEFSSPVVVTTVLAAIIALGVTFRMLRQHVQFG